MKILMTVTLAMLVSASVYAADCKVGDTCSADDCAKLGADFKLNDSKICTKVGSSQGETQCAGIVSSSQAKGSTKDSAATGATGTNVQGK